MRMNAAMATPDNPPAPVPYESVPSPTEEPYAVKVQRVYADPPQDWQRILGNQLWFQFGLYPGGADADVKLDQAGRLYLERQLELAGYAGKEGPQPTRILDVGCGWGGPLVYLAQRFDRCARLDGINISSQQLMHAHKLVHDHGLGDRVRLHLCNAQDIDQLPDSGQPFDLVLFRGSITHFPYAVLERAMQHVRQAMAPHGKLIISDNLYNVALTDYRSPLADDIDRIACGHRKTPGYLTGVLSSRGFCLDDIRVLPSTAETVRWLQDVRKNIESHFAHARSPAIEELYVSCENQIRALLAGLYSVYSLIGSPAANQTVAAQ